MSEAVTMPSLIMMMASLVFKESLARDTHTDFGLVYLKLFQSRLHDLEKKSTNKGGEDEA